MDGILKTLNVVQHLKKSLGNVTLAINGKPTFQIVQFKDKGALIAVVEECLKDSMTLRQLTQS